MKEYETKEWIITTSEARNGWRQKEMVIQVLIQRKITLESVVISAPYRTQKKNQELLSITHKWMLFSEEAIAMLSLSDQLFIFDRLVRKISNHIYKELPK